MYICNGNIISKNEIHREIVEIVCKKCKKTNNNEDILDKNNKKYVCIKRR
jgi:hypothetical protein